ncbi:hypothetical protein CDIK_4430 [Cucumispora dikerogammari]|nr:hypothetical protein CDIK_4430 [Cucumispora dikerogammari]
MVPASYYKTKNTNTMLIIRRLVQFLILLKDFLQKKKIERSDVCMGEIVDETCLSSRKNNKERVLKNIWCVEGISRETKKMFFELAITSNIINIDTIITKHVSEDTLIMTDY